MKKVVMMIVGVMVLVCVAFGGVMILREKRQNAHIEQCTDLIHQIEEAYRQSQITPQSSRLLDVALAIEPTARMTSMDQQKAVIEHLCVDGGDITFVFNGSNDIVGLCGIHETRRLTQLSEPIAMYHRFMAVLADYQTYYRAAYIKDDQLNAFNLLNAFYESQDYSYKSSWPQVEIKGQTYAMLPRYVDGHVDIIATHDLNPYDQGHVKVIEEADYTYDLTRDCWQ